MLRSTIAASLAFAAIAVTGPAAAAVVAVTSTVSGSAGAWVHNFTVVNNLPNTNLIYFFGVRLDTGRSIAGTPGNFDPNAWPSWNNVPYGGSSVVYNNNWIDFSFVGVPASTSVGGFQANDTGTTAQTVIPFFLYAINGSYTGPECFYCGGNPGFEGYVNDVRSTVPEPANWAMLIAGFGLTGAAMRRRRHTAIA